MFSITYIMHWLTGLLLVALLIIIVFMLVIFMPKAKVFYDVPESIKILDLSNLDVHPDDKDNVLTSIIVNDVVVTDKYNGLVSQFNDIDVKNMGILKISKSFNQVKQYGFALNANYTLRCFYTIKQSAAHKSGIWIDGEKRFFTKGEWICGDMCRENSIFNKHKRNDSIVLFIDIPRDKPGNSPNDDLLKDDLLKHML